MDYAMEYACMSELYDERLYEGGGNYEPVYEGSYEKSLSLPNRILSFISNLIDKIIIAIRNFLIKHVASKESSWHSELITRNMGLANARIMKSVNAIIDDVQRESKLYRTTLDRLKVILSGATHQYDEIFIANNASKMKDIYDRALSISEYSVENSNKIGRQSENTGHTYYRLAISIADMASNPLRSDLQAMVKELEFFKKYIKSFIPSKTVTQEDINLLAKQSSEIFTDMNEGITYLLKALDTRVAFVSYDKPIPNQRHTLRDFHLA
jgi:hypothetical protein